MEDAILSAIAAMNEPKTCSTTALKKYVLEKHPGTNASFQGRLSSQALGLRLALAVHTHAVALWKSLCLAPQPPPRARLLCLHVLKGCLPLAVAKPWQAQGARWKPCSQLSRQAGRQPSGGFNGACSLCQEGARGQLGAPLPASLCLKELVLGGGKIAQIPFPLRTTSREGARLSKNGPGWDF